MNKEYVMNKGRDIKDSFFNSFKVHLSTILFNMRIYQKNNLKKNGQTYVPLLYVWW